MKKRTRCIIAISLVAIILGAFILRGRLFPQKEMFVNKRVQESIEKQLQGVDIESIRAKSDLIMEQSVSELQDAVLAGKLTYEELNAFYLDRIKQHDLGKDGLHSVLEINPKAMELARAWDESPKRGQGISGIPVLIKDNINTKAMPTSGGTWALKDYTPKTNSSAVDNLEKNGALILGKANLAELANFMSNAMPNGYSSKGGQTNNPFGPGTISPEGSSSGSGAAVAANLSAFAIGSETVGSIIAPADIQSVVGFKPTVGKVPTEGVIPLAPTTDSLGPMAKNVPDAVALYNAMINDSEEKLSLNQETVDLTSKRIGVLTTEHGDVLSKTLKRLGAEVVEIELETDGIDMDFILHHDFKTNFNAYLANEDAPIKSLSELIEFNQKDEPVRAKYGQDLIIKANQSDGGKKDQVDQMVMLAQKRIDQVMKDKKLEVIAFAGPSGVLLSAVAGYPEITVPLGTSDMNEPVGATFVAKGNEDQKLVNLAYQFEQLTKARLVPTQYLDRRVSP